CAAPMLPYLPCFGVRLFVGTISLVVLTSFVSVLRGCVKSLLFVLWCATSLHTPEGRHHGTPRLSHRSDGCPVGPPRAVAAAAPAWGTPPDREPARNPQRDLLSPPRRLCVAPAAA